MKGEWVVTSPLFQRTVMDLGNTDPGSGSQERMAPRSVGSAGSAVVGSDSARNAIGLPM